MHSSARRRRRSSRWCVRSRRSSGRAAFASTPSARESSTPTPLLTFPTATGCSRSLPRARRPGPCSRRKTSPTRSTCCACPRRKRSPGRPSSSMAALPFRVDLTRDSGLDGKIALVTGGSRGIGRAIVETLAADGVDVTFLYRGNAAAAEDVVAMAAVAGMRVAALRTDIRDARACEATVEQLAEDKGTIDILVNNAGVVRDNVLTGMSDDEVKDVLDTNIGGVFNVTRAVAPFMVCLLYTS